MRWSAWPPPYDETVIEFPRFTPGPPVTVSATLFGLYATCPDRALAQLRGAFAAETRTGFVGGLAHRLFARHLNAGAIAPRDLDRACREEIGSTMNRSLVALGLTRPSQLRPLIAEVGDLYERFKRLPVDGFLGAEVSLEIQPAEGVTLRGRVDAVFADGAVGSRLVDWKTGSAVATSAPQLGFYALLWTIERGDLPARVEAVSVRTGERWGSTPDLAAVQATAATTVDVVHGLRTGIESGEPIERVAGPWCVHCPVLEECPEGRAAAAVAAAG